MGNGKNGSDVRLGKHVIFALDVVQPSPYAKKALVSRKELLGFSGVDKSDSMQELHAVRFTLQLPSGT
jgi:hypothetical protein